MEPFILGALVVSGGVLVTLVLAIAAIVTARRPAPVSTSSVVVEEPRLPYAAAVALVFIACGALLLYPSSLVWYSVIGLVADSRQFRTEAASRESFLGLHLAIVGIAAVLIAGSIAVRSIARRNDTPAVPALLLGGALTVAGGLAVLAWVLLPLVGWR